MTPTRARLALCAACAASIIGSAGAAAARARGASPGAGQARGAVQPQSPTRAARDTTGVQLGTAVRPETVTVGDRFIVQVRIRAPRGATITFPVGPDSGASVEATDPRAIRQGTDSSLVDEIATYRLVAWDTGSVSAALGDAVVSGGARQSVSLAGVRVYVRTVLPRDTALQVPKPARDILAAKPSWWRLLALGLALLALLVLLVWWLWRRRRRRPAQVALVDPFAHAERELDRIEALRLVEAGERSRHVALVVEVLRDYLATRISGAAPSLTSTELLRALQGSEDVPVPRLAPLLAEADLVKFARRPVSAERAREIGRDVRALVQEVEAAARAREQAAQAEARAA